MIPIHQRRGKQSKIQNWHTAIVNIQRRGKQVKYAELNFTDAKMQKQGKQSEIYKIEKLQVSICRDEERKLKYTELKTCRGQYGDPKKAK